MKLGDTEHMHDQYIQCGFHLVKNTSFEQVKTVREFMC